MTTRRLAAILAADVVGFSSMMEKDEEGAAAAIRKLRREVIEPALARHQGRLVKTTGDGFLVEFASPVEAVRSAVAIQEQLALQNGEDAIRLRIGVNLGDIIIEDDGDLFGEGVNIAARLEQVAEPGSIFLSEDIHRQVAGKIDRPFESRGEQQVKNIARPVRVYAIAGERNGKTSLKALPLPDKPSIAVLPFTNMSGDPEQEYFADGIVEDIITALSRVKSFLVIARNSSFTYKGRAADVRQVGRDLGVRYVLEGSIRKGGEHVRIAAQLMDSTTGAHIWSERYDRRINDLFVLQDEITERVVTAVEPTITAVEIERAKRKPPGSLTAYDLYLRALPYLYEPSAGSFVLAADLLREAVRLDPGYADALAALAFCLARSVIFGWMDDQSARQEACDLAGAAILADPQHGGALANSAWVLALLEGRHEQATDVAERALQVHPNSAFVRGQCGWVFLYGGQIERAAEQFQAGLRLDPLDPRARVLTAGLATVHFFNREFEDAVRWCRRTLSESPDHNVARRYLAASLAFLGRREEAQAAIQELVTRQPNSCLSRSLSRSPFRSTWMLDLYVDGLRLAGLPE